MTTLGSDYFPHTTPGGILCLLLAISAFSIFGYITAAVSSYFINKDAADARSPVAGEEHIKEVLREIAGLREELRRIAPRAQQAPE